MLMATVPIKAYQDVFLFFASLWSLGSLPLDCAAGWSAGSNSEVVDPRVPPVLQVLTIGIQQTFNR